MGDWVEVRSPATSANLGPGFDTLGLALEWRQRVWCRLAPGLRVEVRGDPRGRLPRDATNLVARAAQSVLERVGRPQSGLHLVLESSLPVGGGLGSSAAAVAAGLMAAQTLTGEQLSAAELLRLGTAIEGHPDNLAPALEGGVCVASQGSGAGGPVLAVRLPPPAGLEALVAIPDRPLPTEESRRVLPASVPLADAVANVQRASLLVAAIATGRPELLAEATRDRLHQPYRATLLPGLEACLEAAVAAGAQGAFLSGAGPTVLALWPQGAEVPATLADALAGYLRANGGGQVRRLALAAEGTIVMLARAPDERLSS